MGYGLLAGFGRGLSQGASMVQQGMAEDRAVKREDEREKMRQASIERRWKVEDDRYKDQVKRQDAQDQKADSRYKDEVKWREEQSKKQDSQFNAQMRSREAERIEQNIAGLMSAQERHEQKIQDKYREQILSGNGDPKALQKQLENEIAQTRDYYDSKLDDMVKGYGKNLKGTSFEHLLLPKPEIKTDTQTDTTKVDPRTKLISDYVGKHKPSSNGLVDFANQYNNRNVKPTIGQQASNLGLLQQVPLNSGLTDDDLGQFANWAIRK